MIAAVGSIPFRWNYIKFFWLTIFFAVGPWTLAYGAYRTDGWLGLPFAFGALLFNFAFVFGYLREVLHGPRRASSQGLEMRDGTMIDWREIKEARAEKNIISGRRGRGGHVLYDLILQVNDRNICIQLQRYRNGPEVLEYMRPFLPHSPTLNAYSGKERTTLPQGPTTKFQFRNMINFACICLPLIGLFMLPVGVLDGLERYSFVKNGVRATGQVVEIETEFVGSPGGRGRRAKRHRRDYPVILFRDAEGRNVKARVRTGEREHPYRRDEKVPIIFDPADPSHVEINSLFGLWRNPGGFILFGAGFIIVPILFLRRLRGISP